MATLALVPIAPASLYQQEQALEAFADTAELVSPEQEQEFLREFGAALEKTAAKRDAVARFIIHQASQAALCDSEIKRLKSLKDAYEARQEKLEEMVVRVIQSLPVDAKGRPRKLEGHTCTLSIRHNPATVAIQDEAVVPAAYKSVTLTLPVLLWEDILDSVDLEMTGRILSVIKRTEHTVSKTLVKEGIEAQVPDWKDQLKERPSVYTESVPGATISAGTVRLVIQ